MKRKFGFFVWISSREVFILDAVFMHNWSTDIAQLKKNPEKYKIWKLEQQVNFGLDNEKISKKDLKKNWNNITIDPARKKFLHLILWSKKLLI